MNHEHVTKANEDANELWSKTPAWPVDHNGNFLRDEVALNGVILHVMFQDLPKPEPIVASK